MMTKRIAVLLVALLFEVPGTAPMAANPRQAPTLPQAAPFDQAAKLGELRRSLAGKENLPAEAVFKNVTILKGVPAGRLLAIMSMGFGRSLGVDCTHCHVADRWESDEKAAKRIARDMWAMTNAINADHLKRIEGLKDRSPVVNCTTCHRGAIKPALNLPSGTTGEAPKGM
jgi:hypothetical protein